ncbi:MAG: TetR/AcrR family transcriptional regulator [Spirochaetales bacterium]|uniref:TetR/AcrR family transcriptional regulator n=1 Tax=Candidatus Thalassospirochaeta sargassi TaxID=3119039 RepID=A0AAJ1MMC3_9SPIO|nr:TetR/AcrR family transcriptional regulator [Spirochaetales bacterium]
MGSRERAAREKAERRKQREELILSEAEKLFLEKGFFATTISDIAAACELTNGAIYLYYKNKDELVLKVMTGISRHFGGLLEEVSEIAGSEPGLQRLSRLLDVYNYTYAEYRQYHYLDAQFNLMFSEAYPDSPLLDDYYSANRRVLEIVTEAVAAGIDDASIDSSLPAVQRARLLLNAVNSYVEKISIRGILMEKEQGILMKDELRDYIKLLLQGLAK